jgi:hypothetical protein
MDWIDWIILVLIVGCPLVIIFVLIFVDNNPCDPYL